MNKIVKKLTFLSLLFFLGISTLPLQADYEYFKLAHSVAKPVVSTVVPATVAAPSVVTGATAGVASAVATSAVATTSTAAAVGIGVGTGIVVPLIAAAGTLGLTGVYHSLTHSHGSGGDYQGLAFGLVAIPLSLMAGLSIGTIASPLVAYMFTSGGTAGLIAAGTAAIPAVTLAVCLGKKLADGMKFKS